jgi:hypothetical protein
MAAKVDLKQIGFKPESIIPLRSVDEGDSKQVIISVQPKLKLSSIFD